MGAEHDTPQAEETVASPGLELTVPPSSFIELVWSDYEVATIEREESPRLKALKYLPRLLFNPSLQLALLVRIAQRGPRVVTFPIRWLQVVMFNCEIYWFTGPDAIQIGPGIAFPHPFNIIIGPGTKIGTGVTVYNNTQIGAGRHFDPQSVEEDAAHLGDRSVIYAYSAIQGRYDVGHDAVVGIHVVLDDHVPAGGLRTYKKLRLAGEWPGETRTSWHPRAQSR